MHSSRLLKLKLIQSLPSADINAHQCLFLLLMCMHAVLKESQPQIGRINQSEVLFSHNLCSYLIAFCGLNWLGDCVTIYNGINFFLPLRGRKTLKSPDTHTTDTTISTLPFSCSGKHVSKQLPKYTSSREKEQIKHLECKINICRCCCCCSCSSLFTS